MLVTARAGWKSDFAETAAEDVKEVAREDDDAGVEDMLTMAKQQCSDGASTEQNPKMNQR